MGMICSPGLGLRRSSEMKCPHCLHEMFPATVTSQATAYGTPRMVSGAHKGQALGVTVTVHTCPKCSGPTIEVGLKGATSTVYYQTVQAYPRGGPFPPPPPEVPGTVAADYREANEVLPISPKASAALSRRCLQAILASQGYTQKDLVKQIEAVLGEADPTKACHWPYAKTSTQSGTSAISPRTRSPIRLPCRLLKSKKGKLSGAFNCLSMLLNTSTSPRLTRQQNGGRLPKSLRPLVSLQ